MRQQKPKFQKNLLHKFGRSKKWTSFLSPLSKTDRKLKFIVSRQNKILSIGYNGFPSGVSDDEFPWAREGDTLDTKYVYVVHAELNAILNSKWPVTGCTIYVSLFPCNECAKAIIQSGIKRIVYESDKYNGVDTNIASKRMLKAAGVELCRLENTIQLEVKKIPNPEL